ncbi:hypothetical protein EPUS_09093 [Endocarpon pusillum Z07020]|uniref:Extracellular membrane protein CFEM domain-containing protein n=1 Tax=Endocarpon pusillum (strain Z07020 / HMAS-L-300199) TaxID=1263415 RepID=U1GBG2_ENDPU|nr:uncharacterized protein EPUS_09093 [Endocarpon pusillum Z07020]ERF74887.1 hypothetical protein EPUS_09093 [Endocarpon pusillum Z07020]
MNTLLHISLLCSLTLQSIASDAMVRRQSNDIDSETMPECTKSFCAGLGTIIYGGTGVHCPYTDSDAKTWSRQCFCNLKTPLRCAWICNWNAWMNAEDWYTGNTGCGPQADDLDLKGLPACAEDCLPDALMDAGCITKGRQCFCLNGDMLGCQNSCSHQERAEVATWLEGACNISQQLANQGVEKGSFLEDPSFWATLVDKASVIFGGRGDEGVHKEVVAPPSRTGQPLRWYEIWAVVVLCFTAVAILIGWRVSSHIGRIKSNPAERASLLPTGETL